MEFSVPVRVAPCQTRSMPEEVGYYVANHRLGRVGVRLEVQHPVMLRWGQGLTCVWRLCRCLRVLRWTGYLDRIEVELSESSAAPADDTHTGAGDSPDHQKVGPSPTALPAVPNLIRLSTPPTPPTSRPSIPSGTQTTAGTTSSRQWYTITPPQWPNISAPLTFSRTNALQRSSQPGISPDRWRREEPNRTEPDQLRQQPQLERNRNQSVRHPSNTRLEKHFQKPPSTGRTDNQPK